MNFREQGKKFNECHLKISLWRVTAGLMNGFINHIESDGLRFGCRYVEMNEIQKTEAKRSHTKGLYFS